MDQLRAMRVFVRVIDEGSFAGAARAMELAPAVVTRLIAELEEHLGIRLIQRTTRSLSLSPAGERYLERVRQILSDLEDARAMLQTTEEEPQGHLRVLLPNSFATYQLTRHLPRFHAAFPKITLSLIPGTEASSPNSRHDIAIVMRRTPPENDGMVQRLARSDVVLCAAPRYLEQHGHPNTPEALTQHRLLLRPTALLQKEIVFTHETERRSVRLPAPRQPLLASSRTDTLLAATLSGLGIAGLTTLVAEQFLRQGALERVLPGWNTLSLGLWMTMPAQRHIPPRTQALWDFLLSTFGGEDHDPWQPIDAISPVSPERTSLSNRDILSASVSDSASLAPQTVW